MCVAQENGIAFHDHSLIVDLSGGGSACQLFSLCIFKNMKAALSVDKPCIAADGLKVILISFIGFTSQY